MRLSHNTHKSIPLINSLSSCTHPPDCLQPHWQPKFSFFDFQHPLALPGSRAPWLYIFPQFPLPLLLSSLELFICFLFLESHIARDTKEQDTEKLRIFTCGPHMSLFSIAFSSHPLLNMTLTSSCSSLPRLIKLKLAKKKNWLYIHKHNSLFPESYLTSSC